MRIIMLIRLPFSCLCLLWFLCFSRRVLTVLLHFEITSLEKPSCRSCYLFDFVFCPLPGQKWHIGKAILYFKNQQLKYHRKSCHRSTCLCPTSSSPIRIVYHQRKWVVCAKSSVGKLTVGLLREVRQVQNHLLRARTHLVFANFGCNWRQFPLALAV